MKTKNKEDLLLGIESSGLTSCISIGQRNHLLGQVSLNIKNIHSRRMTIMVEQLLQHIGFELSDLSGIVLSAGPGSFTGLRIGYSLAKGFAHSLNLPVVQVCTLDVWAYQQGYTILPVISVIDAHRQELFIGNYYWDMDKMNRAGDYQLIKITDLPKIIKAETLFVGGDLHKVAAEIKGILPEKALLPFPLQTDPQAATLLKLGFEKYQKEAFSSAEDCEPFYMRAFQGVM